MIERSAMERWGKTGKSGIDILIAPTIPPHYRAPGNLKIIFLQPSNHRDVLESILVRALQPDPSLPACPITVRELTPPNPEKRKFITVPIILGRYFEPVPEPVIKPEPRLSTPIEPPVSISIELPHEVAPKTPKPRPQRLSLKTDSGIDLRTLTDKQFDQLTTRLTPTQLKYLAVARNGKSVPEMARKFDRQAAGIYSSIRTALSRIDHPRDRHVDHQRIKKEKTHSPRKQAQFLFEGQSLFEIPEDQRKKIYARVHLTPRNILAIESYIYAIQHNLRVNIYVAQSINTPGTGAVYVMLSHIRKKLARPDKYEPKTRLPASLVTP